MSKATGKTSPTSMRGGALILRSISIFLTSGRNARAPSQPVTKTKTRKMTDKDNKNKISIRLLEIAKRDTHFNR